MALTSTTNRNDYVGNGATSVYSYTFRIFVNTDLRVTVRNTANGTETQLILTTDYTVSGVGDVGGGSITLVNAGQAWLSSGNLATGYELTIRRVRPLTQTTDIRNQGDFFPESHEDEFDRGVMVAQQQQDEIDRAVKLPETLTSADFDPKLPATIAQADKTLITNSAGTGWALGASATVDVARMFTSGTDAELRALAAAAPTLQRWGWATDTRLLMFYTADVAVGVGGWLTVAGG